MSHVGAVATRLLADRVGLTGALSQVLARRGFTAGHDRGRVLVDLAVMIADGGEAIADIDVLRHQSQVLGPVASPATVWRALKELTPARLAKVAWARARVRRHVWDQFARLPASPVAGSDLGTVVVLDVDATILIAHSEKESAAPTYKHTFGFHPLAVWCDNTGEWLSIRLRPGNAGANNAADHVAVLTDAFAQVPARHRRNVLVRSDTAGASHAVLDWLAGRNNPRWKVQYSIGWSITEDVRTAICALSPQAWIPAMAADGDLREGADVTKVTGLLDLSGWPQGMRIIVRRERPHPGAQLTLFEEADGWRYTAFATNTTDGAHAFLEARHRAHARVEDRIRCAKDTGLRRLPSREFAINQAWLTAVAIAADLTAWLQILTLTLTGELARAEPKTLRYRIGHVAARLVHGGRRRTLRIPAAWPWARQLADAFARIRAIPAPG